MCPGVGRSRRPLRTLFGLTGLPHFLGRFPRLTSLTSPTCLRRRDLRLPRRERLVGGRWSSRLERHVLIDLDGSTGTTAPPQILRAARPAVATEIEVQP